MKLQVCKRIDATSERLWSHFFSLLSNQRAEWNECAGWAEIFYLSYQKVRIEKNQ
jgi:hypothetical protein